MEDASPIAEALQDANIEIEDEEPASNGELETDEEKVKKSPRLILARIIWIGDQITRVSKSTRTHPFQFVFFSLQIQTLAYVLN